MEYIGLNPDAGGNGAHKGPDEDTDDTQGPCQSNGDHQVDDGLRHRFIAVIPVQPHGVPEGKHALTEAGEVEIHHNQQHDRECKQIGFLQPDGADKVVQQNQQ